MNNIKRFQQNSGLIIAAAILLSNLLLAGIVMMLSSHILPEHRTAGILLLVALSGLIAFFLSMVVGKLITAPFESVWQGLLHVSKQQNSIGAPHVEDLQIGRELTAQMINQIYDLASSSRPDTDQNSRDPAQLAHKTIKTLPLPMLVLDADQKITYGNDAARAYFGVEAGSVVGKSFADVANLLFPSELTLEKWLNETDANTLTSTQTWERVRVDNQLTKTRHQCDLVAYFNKGLGEDFQSSLVFFDRTNAYDHNDEEMSFVALAVHELRTPLTIMRGYIEVFEEEFEGKLSDDMNDFMHKLSASAQALSAFISNILNVSRIENNQLVLHLEEHDWQQLLHTACDDMEMRAKVRGKHFVYNVHTQIPTIAVDKVSIYEVLSNLLDNAVKYSGDSKEIVISARVTSDGMIETTIQDFGAGIPMSIMPHLFDKFYRNHRSRDQIGGTGLGLFLCKAIIEAHGGNIWVKSKEGEGSTFGFTLQSYKNVANNPKNDDNGAITRGSYGWIKNHSMYRR